MKAVLVTGASRGLGLSICQMLLVRSQFCVVGLSRTRSAETEALLHRFQGRYEHLIFDLGNLTSLESDLIPLLDSYKYPFCGLVNNAGVTHYALISNESLDRVEKSFAVNFFAPVLLSKWIIRHLVKQKNCGSLVHISSISASKGFLGLSTYASAKGALISFSRSISSEWGSRGIRSNIVEPGLLNMGMKRVVSERQIEHMLESSHLKQLVSVESVASLVGWLLSDAAQSVTGQVFRVNSGIV